MKYFFKILLIATAILASGCQNESKKSTSKNFEIISESISHSYDEITDFRISWTRVFEIDLDDYYVYFFSLTCGHCAQLKDFIIEEALREENIYFVEASEEMVFLKDVEQTIGLNSLEGFGILGFPSIVKIGNHIVCKNIAGVSSIKNELSN